MKKFIIILAAAITMAFTATNANAQYNTFSKGDHLLQASIGLPRFGGIPAFNIAFEHGVADFGRAGSLGVGGSFEFTKNFGVDIALEAIATYHFFINDRFEVHAKLGAGCKNNEYGLFSESAFVGITYYFGEHFAVQAETGYSYTTNIRAGIAYKF